MSEGIRICSKCSKAKALNILNFVAYEKNALGFKQECRDCGKDRCRARYKILKSVNPPKYEANCYKKCYKCKVNKEITKNNFSTQADAYLGVANYCKSCVRELYLIKIEERKNIQSDRNFVKIKLCRQCHRKLPSIAFYASTHRKDKLRRICIECQKYEDIKRYICGSEINTNELRNKIELFFGYCAYCKIKPFAHIDHFYPLNPKKGARGSNSINNLFPTCSECNLSKSNKDPFEWFSEKGYSIPKVVS